MNQKNTGKSGVGISTVLTIVFIVLKLVGVIDWSWWWVVSPTLISVGFTILVLVGFGIYSVYLDRKYGLTSKKGRRDKWKF
jgi:hypothetical protein